MKNCDVTRDLLPLYMDASCSEDSREFVDTHMAECPACRSVHDAASKTVETMLTGKKVRKSFGQFRRKTRLKKTLLILLCIAVSLTALGFALYPTVWDYLTESLPVRIGPVESAVSRLSDGSIYLSIHYSEEDVYVDSIMPGYLPGEDNTLVVELRHSRISDMDWNLNNAGRYRPFIIPTKESFGLYNPESRAFWSTSHPYTEPPYSKIVLSGPDGERVIWEEGDDIPAADDYAERYLRQLIYDGKLISKDDSQ